MTNIIDISNIINVSITTTPQGLGVTNVNNIAIFTNEAPSNSDVYRQYISAAAVAADYGTSSVTAAMANNIFAQSPNIRTGGGQLAIIPLQASVSAVAGKTTTASLTANLTAILAVTSGDLKVTINSVITNLTKLNFTGATTLANVATIINQSLADAVVTAVGSTLVFTSKKVGTASTVTIAAVSGGTGTDLAGAGYFISSTSTPAAGTNSSGETILAAITRTSGAVPYTGVITNIELEDTAISTIAAGIQAQDFLFLHHFASTQDVAGIALTVKTATQTKTRCLLYTVGLAEANLMKAAYVGRAFSVNVSGSFTASTMHLKTLANVVPDSGAGIGQTLYNNAMTDGIDSYLSVSGSPSVISTGGNDFFDNQYMNLALKFALEVNGFNYLKQTNTKVPQTEQGMNGLKSAYAVVCNQFVKNGFIAATNAWNSSETFGDPEIFRQNILDAGFYIYSSPIVEQLSTDRELRKAPLVQIAIKRAGAIHSSDVLVVINN